MNVQQTIIKGVQELLYFNNFLVLPGFGGFVLKKIPAHLSASGGMLMPPSKTIGFNAQLKQNDGLLVQWLQAHLKCSQQQALQHLTDFSAWCDSVLQNKGRLSIDGLGFFYTDFEKNICFEPQQQINFLASSFGLTALTVKETEQQIPEKREAVFVDRRIKEAETKNGEKKKESRELKNYRKYRRGAVAVLSGALILSAISLVLSNSKISGQLKATVFGKEISASYTAIPYPPLDLQGCPAEKTDYVADANGVAVIRLEDKSFTVRAIEMAPASNPKYASPKNVELIVGCFSVPRNAKRLVNKLKRQNIPAYISARKHRGMQIVCGGGFNSREEALQALPALQSIVPNAWIKQW